MTATDFGRATQARFLLDAHLHGMLVAIPWDSVPGYDALVDTGRKVYRVQVKGSRPSASKARNTYRINTNRLRRRNMQYDILAVWLDADSKWLLMPENKTRVRQLVIYPTGAPHKYSNRWDIFR